MRSSVFSAFVNSGADPKETHTVACEEGEFEILYLFFIASFCSTKDSMHARPELDPRSTTPGPLCSVHSVRTV